ncbi:MAG: glycosyltransferase family 2 protein [Pirellulales bacterium]
MIKLSVVTPSFNQAKYLRATLESIHSQQYPNLEHWVIDGGSTDGSLEILEEYRRAGLLNYISEPDRGQSDAINKGFARISGEVVCWLNSDDLYNPGTLLSVSKFFEDNPDKQLLTGDCNFIDAEGRHLTVFVGSRVSRESLIRVTSLNVQPATFFRRTLLDKVQGLNSSLHYALDYDFWLRMTRHVAFEYRPQTFASARMHLECKSMRPNHETFLPEVVRCSRQHFGPVYLPAYWLRFLYLSRHCSKVYYEAALTAKREGHSKQFLQFLLRAVGYAPWKILYWKDLLSAILKPTDLSSR